MQRRLIILLFAIIALGLLTAAVPAQAQTQPRTRCFAETGFCVSDPILSYWERNGGLAVFGYPISPLQVETVEGWSGPVQWFERDRLEDHGRVGVLAGRLGARLLEIQGRPWETLPQVDQAPRGCRFFAETGHSLCGVFLNYWVNNGGLERFGYPISEPMQETLFEGSSVWTGTVQYFERRRMEHHTELAGTRYEVLLGLLGRDIYERNGCAEAAPPLRATVAAYRHVLPCPAPFPQVGARMAVQPFERGAMVWVESVTPNVDGAIFVVYFDNRRGSLVWELYSDTWREGQPVSGGETPPPGLYEPIRGFGKLWRNNPQVRSTLGWAAGPEQAETGTLQYFRGGAWMLHRAGSDRIYIFYADNRADDIARIYA